MNHLQPRQGVRCYGDRALNKPCPHPWAVHSAGEIRCRTNACSSRQYLMSVRKRQKESWRSFIKDADFPPDLKARQDLGSSKWGWGAEAGWRNNWSQRDTGTLGREWAVRSSCGTGHVHQTSFQSSPPWGVPVISLLHTFLRSGDRRGPFSLPGLLPDHCSSGFDGNTGALRLVLFYSTTLSPTPHPHHPYCLPATLSFSLRTLTVAGSLFTHLLVSCHNPGWLQHPPGQSHHTLASQFRMHLKCPPPCRSATTSPCQRHILDCDINQKVSISKIHRSHQTCSSPAHPFLLWHLF